MTKSKKAAAPGSGGSRKGAGRPPTIKKGKRIGVYVPDELLKRLKVLKIVNLSEFFRDAAERKTIQAERNQHKLQL